MHESQPTYEFGPFRLNANTRLLWRDGVRIPLAPKVLDTLVVLIEHRDRVVTKDELLERVWGRTVIEEGGLARNISVLRKALGEKPDQHTYIVTVPGRGYRFVADVRETAATEASDSELSVRNPPTVNSAGAAARMEVASAHERRATAAAAGERRKIGSRLSWSFAAGAMAVLAVGSATYLGYVSPRLAAARSITIAVLPFVNRSQDPEQEHFADGLSEQLMSELARIRELNVKSRTSAFYFKGRNEPLRTIGEMLGVENVLEGSVQRADNRVRIRAQLFNTQSGSRLWSDEYDRDFDDIFAIQEDIARAVAESLEVTLGVGDLGRQPGMTRDVEAYEQYLKGRALMGQSPKFRLAIDHLQRATQIDTSFSLAWVWLSEAYSRGVVFLGAPEDEWVAKADAALAQALELTPESRDVLAQAAWHAASQGDWLAAGRAYDALLESVPVLEAHIARDYGVFLVCAGRPREAVEWLERASADERLSTEVAGLLALAYESSGNLAAATAERERLLAMPGIPSSLLSGSALITALASGDRASIDRRLAALPSDPRGLNAAMARFLDDRPAARAEIERLLASSRPGDHGDLVGDGVAFAIVAQWAGYYGHPDLALKALRRMPVAMGAWAIGLQSWLPNLSAMRKLPEFKDLVRDIGLVDYWREFGWSDFCRPIGENDFECS
jgi:TolB-like protein/DNA-binding winged helix-turn-helix (wHTH) protein/tetratricopeptide (TPR) repeat protein